MNTHNNMKEDLQSCGEEARRIIFVLENVVAFIDCIKQQESVSHTKQCSQATSNQLSRRGSRAFLNMLCQLLYQLLLAPLDVGLEQTQNSRFIPRGIPAEVICSPTLV